CEKCVILKRIYTHCLPIHYARNVPKSLQWHVIAILDSRAAGSFTVDISMPAARSRSVGEGEGGGRARNCLFDGRSAQSCSGFSSSSLGPSKPRDFRNASTSKPGSEASPWGRKRRGASMKIRWHRGQRSNWKA